MATKTKEKPQAPQGRRTTAVYYKTMRELELVKKAARMIGVPFTRFIR